MLLISLWYYLAYSYPTSMPYKTALYFLKSPFTPHAKLTKEILGFMPYWRTDDMKYYHLDLLSEINYFALTVDKDGQFIKVIRGETNPGWLGWNKEAVKDLITKSHIYGTRFSLTIQSQKNSVIENILDSKFAQETLIKNITEQVATRHLDGVIIDFEYTGKVSYDYKESFTDFSRSLASEIHKINPNTKLSLAIMPLAAREKDLFDFPALAPLYDRFIGMSYDYYGIGSDIAGPIAPMKGFSENKYFFDVTTTYADYLKFIPKNKIVMGVPYYGWDWAVEDGKTIQSKTFPSDDPKNYAAVISYARTRESKDLKKNQCTWDEYALETWCWYTDPKTKTDHQVWLEDNKSIETRFNFARSNNFSGIAIWVLGYDKDYPDLWNMLQAKFSKK